MHLAVVARKHYLLCARANGGLHRLRHIRRRRMLLAFVGGNIKIDTRIHLHRPYAVVESDDPRMRATRKRMSLFNFKLKPIKFLSIPSSKVCVFETSFSSLNRRCSLADSSCDQIFARWK
jgi:hypothetical protein